jgi:hypothetical protein
LVKRIVMSVLTSFEVDQQLNRQGKF